MYPAILTSDLHLTDAPRDEYRWSVFDRIAEQQKRTKARSLFLLGDLTDAKDRHSARLVRRVVGAVARMDKVFDRVVLLKGNHDYVNEDFAFFTFLDLLPGVTFVETPQKIEQCVFIPHSRAGIGAGLKLVREDTHYCFLHFTAHGARSSNGQVMQGEDVRLPHTGRVAYYSGDIHVPQRVGGITYVGSPYPVHFGDDFPARMLLLHGPDKNAEEVRWEGVRRVVVVLDPDKEEAGWTDALRPKDQVKVRVNLSRYDVQEWAEIKDRIQSQCDWRGLVLSSIEVVPKAVRRQLVSASVERAVLRDQSESSVLRRYAQQQAVDALVLEAGEGLL